jgi:hypothetical protein
MNNLDECHYCQYCILLAEGDYFVDYSVTRFLLNRIQLDIFMVCAIGKVATQNFCKRVWIFIPSTKLILTMYEVYAESVGEY